MVWCRQATSHYLSQCWHISVSPTRHMTSLGHNIVLWLNSLQMKSWFVASMSIIRPKLETGLDHRLLNEQLHQHHSRNALFTLNTVINAIYVRSVTRCCSKDVGRGIILEWPIYTLIKKSLPCSYNFLGPVSLRLMTSQFKVIVTHTQK